MARCYSDVCVELRLDVEDVDFIVIDNGEGDVHCVTGDAIHGSSPETVGMEIVMRAPGVWYTSNLMHQALKASFHNPMEH